jgi:hypothetical protein
MAVGSTSGAVMTGRDRVYTSCLKVRTDFSHVLVKYLTICAHFAARQDTPVCKLADFLAFPCSAAQRQRL